MWVMLPGRGPLVGDPYDCEMVLLTIRQAESWTFEGIVAFWVFVAALFRLILWMVERGMADSQSARLLLHPDGCIGDPDELAWARRYRAADQWIAAALWALPIALLLQVSVRPSQFGWMALVLAGGMLVILNVFVERKISGIIGHKWSLRLEWKERRRQLR